MIHSVHSPVTLVLLWDGKHQHSHPLTDPLRPVTGPARVACLHQSHIQQPASCSALVHQRRRTPPPAPRSSKQWAHTHLYITHIFISGCKHTSNFTLEMSRRRVRDRPEAGGQDEPNALACLPFTVCERLLVFAGMESLQEREDVLFRLDGPSCRLSSVFQGKYLERRRLNLGWSEFPKGLIQLLLQRPLSSLDSTFLSG